LAMILEIVPFLFFGGLGNDLQRPLALTIVGGLAIGALVSLYIVPIIYWLVYRHEDKKLGS